MAAKRATVKPVVKPVAKAAEAAVEVEAPKTTSAKAEDKATTAVESVKAEEKKAEPASAKKGAVKKETAKKTSAEKTSAKKETAGKETVKKERTKRAASKKTEPTAEIHIQFADQSLTQDDLVKIARDVWKYDLNQKVGDLESIELYVKPEERRAYYVMNKDFTGSFGI